MELQKSNNDLRMKNNDLEQYMRRSNLRIFGLDVSKEKDCVGKAATYLRDALSILLDPSDVEVAHVVPSHKKIKSTGSAPDRKTVILIRFRSKASRELVMKHRRKLKNTGISISDDLTAWNMEILRNLRDDDRIENTWSWNGKLFCEFKSSDVRVPVRPFESVEDLQNKLELLSCLVTSEMGDVINNFSFFSIGAIRFVNKPLSFYFTFILLLLLF